MLFTKLNFLYKLIQRTFCLLLLKKNTSEFLFEQRVKSNEQRAKSNEHRAKCNEQKVTSNKQKATSNERKKFHLLYTEVVNVLPSFLTRTSKISKILLFSSSIVQALQSREEWEGGGQRGHQPPKVFCSCALFC